MQGISFDLVIRNKEPYNILSHVIFLRAIFHCFAPLDLNFKRRDIVDFCAPSEEGTRKGKKKIA